MNNNLYNPNYIPTNGMVNNMNNYNESYVENYLRNNIGKRVKVHVSFCDSVEWRDSIFQGILKEVGKDYIVVSNNQEDYIIWSVYIDYVIMN